ncbi:MAG: triose-phosphate isomerase [Candidatus Cloacimonetes bacterium]|nr:triose-phosphate isomerase [Candidatus Cloacimonadota bacterium]
MRKIYIAGNWKMNKSCAETVLFLNSLIDFNNSYESEKIEQIICPPFIYLEKAKEITANSVIKIGAQNCSEQDNGAYTGEVSANMLKDIKVEYCIIGHSERREYYGENDKLIQSKYLKLKEHGIVSIICIGETLDERESGNTFEVIKLQLEGIFDGIDTVESDTFVLAYEPVWAIGTGKTATPEQAQEVHHFIRTWLKEKYNKQSADSIAILYGGSVKPSNIKELLSCPDIDGGLIGGASLDNESYKDMLTIAKESEC